ncbi:MAG: adenylate/guanylate cyclase domain-containing protein [Spirochaetales bacterium]|nr:adenylate/guanylate cyclase domain-containing protein [Spirochaetales bacterium]
MKKKLLKILLGALIGLAGGAVGIILFYTGILSGFEGQTWDIRARLLAEPENASDEIVLILLDQESLDWGESELELSWPWPRITYGAVTKYCERAGAKCLAFDVIYSEPSFYGVTDDEIFRDYLNEFGKAIGALALSESEGNDKWPEELADKLPDIEIGDGFSGETYTHATFPTEDLAAAFARFANVQDSPDPDGIYRETRPVSLFNGKAVPNLSLSLFLLANPDLPVKVSPQGISAGKKYFPLDSRGNAILRFHGQPHENYTTYNASAIIQSESRVSGISEGEPIVKPEELKDKYVLFGFSAPGLKDIRPSSVDEKGAGVEIHAAALDNLLNEGFMIESPVLYTILIILLLSLCIGIAASLLPKTLPTVLLFLLAITLPISGGVVTYLMGIKFPVVAPLLSLVLTMVTVSVYNFSTEGRQKRFLKSAFRQYLSPALIEQLIADPDKLKLGGERKELSIFFSDLQGFTTISEALSPEELTALLNDYLSAMTDIIMEEGGTVDKYEGDAIIAFWNAPMDLENHAVHAVRSALRCQVKLAELRPVFKERTQKEMYMRIGMNTADVVVGNMGSRDRFDYTMMGDGVNLAARLEGINKQFYTYTMISQWTKAKIGDAFPTRELSRVAVVGKKEAVTVYEPMYPEDYEKKKKIIANFLEGLKYFYDGKFEQARTIFDRSKQGDPAALAYSEKCSELIAKPPPGWNGVWVMTSK